MGFAAQRHSWSFATRCLVFCALLWPHDALAFDPFGFFGDKPPAVSQHALPYALTFKVSGGTSDLFGSSTLIAPLQEASSLYRLRQDAPIDGQSLVRRAANDLAPMLDALWSAGYYNAKIEIEVAGHHLRLGRPPPAGIAAAAEAYRAREPVPIQVAVKTGPLFHLRRIRITDARTGRPFPPTILPPRAIKLAPGDPARAAVIRAARAALVDWFRAQARPLAKVTKIKPVVYHSKQAMDVAIAVDPGPRASFGNVTVTGRSQVDPRVVRSHVYIEPGYLYSPTTIAETRKSILSLPAISSVRIHEAKALDAQGRLPITVDVTDRKRHVVGFSARYSTLDGPDVSAYWQHRNLFGGGESLRLEGEAFLPPQTYGSFIDSLDTFGWSDLGGRFKASFVKPALRGTRNDLLLDGVIEKDRTGGDQLRRLYRPARPGQRRHPSPLQRLVLGANRVQRRERRDHRHARHGGLSSVRHSRLGDLRFHRPSARPDQRRAGERLDRGLPDVFSVHRSGWSKARRKARPTMPSTMTRSWCWPGAPPSARSPALRSPLFPPIIVSMPAAAVRCAAIAIKA